MAEDHIMKAVTQALKQSPDRKFKESVELAINLKDVDLANPKNRLTEEVILPKGRGKDVKIGTPEIDLFATRPDAETLKKQKYRVKITIPVEEGEPYTVGSVRV
ncbi:MAG: hypothetical protein ACMUHU_00180, partial [Thermoplasmatota archaeon]